jgi:hypothetical protein
MVITVSGIPNLLDYISIFLVHIYFKNESDGRITQVGEPRSGYPSFISLRYSSVSVGSKFTESVTIFGLHSQYVSRYTSRLQAVYT